MKHLGKIGYPLVFILLFSIVGTSCKPRLLFTEANRGHLEQKGIDMSRVQFFTDKELILRRLDPTTDTQVANGEIRQVDQENTDELRIPRGTPGLLEKMDDGMLWINFEDRRGTQLRFKRNKYDHYQIDADKWYDRRGEVTYDGKIYYLTPPHNDALLQVKKRELQRELKNSRIVRGNRINKRKRKNFRRTNDNQGDDFENYQGDPKWDDDDQWEEGGDDDLDSDTAEK